ncbi:daptide biosynthesis intramembrane metalloprotease [Streptomyces sp. NPDC085946]|uniref:daptide biosynthesis intramembrane metalloprotease n=1 Tax=Streptomyces sp. NPDC085946 TaxID=3365744 RepID=UPI0037D046A2
MPATKTAAAPDLERPRTAGDVAVHEPLTDGAPWVIQRGEHQHFRTSENVARLVRLLDGSRDHGQLAAALGRPWTADHVDRAVRNLADSRLLDDGTPVRRVRRVRFAGPLTIQFTLLKPERMLRRLTPLIRPLAHRAVLAAAAAVTLLGVLALAACGPALGAALSRPMPLWSYAAVMLGVLLTTAVHEVAHGAVLTHHGGRPSRMGFMLFYMSPAFFCDVSDGWRLPTPRQRVQVALAGIAVQAVAAGSAGLAALLVPAGPARDTLLLVSLVNYLTCAVNLLPLVKLDGYIALMSHLDVSHLREKAMADARRFLARLLFGGRDQGRELPGRRWAVPYGIACLLFPLYLVSTALTLWSSILQRLGVAGSALMVCGLGYLLWRLGKGTATLVGDALRAGARPLRVAAAGLLAALSLGLAATLVQVPATVSAGYTTNADGSLSLLVPEGGAGFDLTEGTRVTLRRSGLLSRPEVGTARLGEPVGRDTLAPLTAMLPVDSGRPWLAMRAYPLERGATTPAAHGPDRTGVAEVRAGDHPLWKWFAVSYLGPLLP